MFPLRESDNHNTQQYLSTTPVTETAIPSDRITASTTATTYELLVLATTSHVSNRLLRVNSFGDTHIHTHPEIPEFDKQSFRSSSFKWLSYWNLPGNTPPATNRSLPSSPHHYSYTLLLAVMQTLVAHKRSDILEEDQSLYYWC